ACFAMLGLAIILVLFSNKYHRRLLLQQLQNQEELVQHTILTQEKERQRIASDLHDEIGSKLNVIHLYTHQFLKHDPTPVLKTKVGELSEIINQTIQTTRRISHELLPPTLEELGLIPALDELVNSFNDTGTIQIALQQNGPDLQLQNKVTELNLFRIIQELINNSIKHGKAALVEIQINSQTGQIHYQDNGQGADVPASDVQKGLGMRNIESRLKIIKGSWTYQLEANKGFQAIIRLNPTP
ncbi:MAG: histidine kinase, partial [Bacteroidota bacterium]